MFVIWNHISDSIANASSAISILKGADALPRVEGFTQARTSRCQIKKKSKRGRQHLAFRYAAQLRMAKRPLLSG